MQHLLNKKAFVQYLDSGEPLLLDGGLSNQLEALGYNLDNPLWSAILLKQNPQAIIQAHLDYLNAGARCLITASYQATLAGFRRLGLSDDEGKSLLVKSVSLAQSAIEQFMQSQTTDSIRPLIAASIGPYGAFLADGSEYHGNYGVGDDVLMAFHQARIHLLDQTPADVLACETIPCHQEAQVLADLLKSTKTPAWVSFACRNEAELNDGTVIEKAAAAFVDNPNVLAIGVNCTAPQYINALIEKLKSIAPNKAIIVYPNSGEHYHPKDKTWSGTCTPQDVGKAAIGWRKSGANIIGGCCRMGPEHIEAMNNCLLNEQNIAKAKVN